jgi:hypothetical protein
MSTIPVNLAIEDRLSEAVLRRVLAHANRGYAIGTAYGRGGFGYLRRTVRGWNSAAAGVPFALLTDLDGRYGCPQALIDDWLGVPRHHNLLLRVAVQEVESWLLADGPNLAEFLAVSPRLIPQNVDTLDDPKAVLIGIARRSRLGEIRRRIAPKPGSTASIGPDYNACLIEFVASNWDVDAAAGASTSLARALNRFRSFAPLWPPAQAQEG